MKPSSKCRRSGLPAVALALLAATLTNLSAQPAKTARSSPQWVRDGVVYEIFPRNFSAEGNFNGITARLDELKDLGVNILWLMPIHPLGEKMRKGTLGSPYAIRDYYAINPDYGTEADFKRLVSEAHQRGLKVIIDIVANHTAWDSVLMQHPEFYKQDASGKIIPPVKEWTDVAGLNYTNPQLREYMIAMLKHWIDPARFDLDGFRCDVASEVPTSFWEEARAELTKVKPDIIMLAEASKPELLVKAFDVDYSWPLHSTLNDVLLSGAPASEFKRSWEESQKQFPKGSLHLRFSDNHDEARAVARFSIKGALAASALMFSPRRRSPPLQRHGSRRRHGIRRPGLVREAAGLLASEGPPAPARDLPGPDQAAQTIPGVSQRPGRLAAQFRRSEPGHLHAPG